MLTAGQIIVDRYSVDRMLAHGGMATVYVVRHLTLDSLYALKVLDIPTSDIKRRLLQEGRIQASLRHPNIVAVTDAIDIDGHPALVMEFVDGPTLSDVIASAPPDPEHAEAWFRQILGAVSYAHTRGLVHRDLKPDNVLMAPINKGYLPKVADFGIAKVLQDYLQRGEGPMTRTGVGMGTPAYMPPEQMQSAGQVDHRADIFALGCILYELMCGQRAFPGENLLSILNAAAEGNYVPPWEHRKELDERIVAAIDGATAPSVHSRLQSCDELLEVLNGNVVRATKTPAPVGVKRPPRQTQPDDPAPRRVSLGRVAVVSVMALMLVAGVTMGVVAVAGGLAGLAFWRTNPSTGTTLDADPKPTWTAPAPVPEAVAVPLHPKAIASRYDVQVHGWRTVARVQQSVIKYQPENPNNVLYLMDVTVSYTGDETDHPTFPWDLILPDGTDSTAPLGCHMANEPSINPFASYEPGDVIRGEICFEGPPNTPGLRVRFSPEPDGSTDQWFALD